MKDLADLRPSLKLGAISPSILRHLPIGGVYLFASVPQDQEGWKPKGPTGCVLRIQGWDGDTVLYDEHVLPLARAAQGRSAHWVPRGRGLDPIREGWWHYPLLPALSFALTTEQMSTPGSQPSGRMKSVTRRGSCPKWCRPGVLFNGWDRSFRVGKDANGHTKARGLGTYRVVSVVEVGRWRCPDCWWWLDPMAGFENTLWCRRCDQPWKPTGPRGIQAIDTLTPEELTLEGFPGMDPDEFWAMLVKGGQVRKGKARRISFEAAS